MTVTYTGDVANARLCAFSRLLLRWKGSIYKLLYREMFIFCTLYAILSLIYRMALNEERKRTFERVVLYCEMFINLIPLSFVLGFYVAIVVTRWWNQYIHIPWPDRVMLYVSTMIDGADEHARLIRRTLMRYLTLGSLIVFQATSVRIKKRFPTMEHLIEAGVVTRSEVQALDEISTPHGKWWIPFVWCGSLLKDARKQGLIADNYLFKSLIDEISAYRGNLGMLYAYDWISIPLVYTQVTTLAVYTFFLGCTFGRQFLDPAQNYPGHSIDLYFPFFTFLQFFFYMGWLKVAEQLINPFGEDDDDFEMNWIIDRNMQVSLLTADDMCGQFPPLEKDVYFGEPPPDYLPYTKSSVKGMTLPHMGSTADMRISDEGMKVLTVLETIQEGVALQGPSKFPSYLGTPRRIVTPAPSPKPNRYQNQNLMSGVRSPDVLSRMSLQSCRDSEPSGNHLTVPGSGGGANNVFLRATEKLGCWLIHHSSRVDLNPNAMLNGGTSFAGLLSRQVSSTAVNDHDESETSESNRDLADESVIISPRGIALSPLRLSPVAEMFCSKSAPTSGHVHLTQGSTNDLLQEHLVLSSQTQRLAGEDRFCVTPTSTRYLRQSSLESGGITTKEIAGGEKCFQINSDEPNRDGKTLVELGDQNGEQFDTARVRWSDNLEQIACQQLKSSRSNSLSRNERNLQSSNPVINLPSSDRVLNDTVLCSNLNDSCDINMDAWNASEKSSALLNQHTIPFIQYTTVIMDTTEDTGSTPSVHHNGSESSYEYDAPESHQCTVNSLTPLLGDLSDDRERKAKC